MIAYVTETIQGIQVMFLPDIIWSIVLTLPPCINSDDLDWNLEVDRFLSASLIPERNEYTSENLKACIHTQKIRETSHSMLMVVETCSTGVGGTPLFIPLEMSGL